MGLLATLTMKMAREKIRNIVEGVRYFTGMEVVVGIPKEANADHGGISNAELLYLHEQGVPSRNIPPRPVLKPAMNKKETQAQIKTLMRDAAMAAIMSGNKDGCAAMLEKAGMEGASACKNYITAGSNLTPNAPATIARKGSSKPLIDTAAMLNSITYAVRKKE